MFLNPVTPTAELVKISLPFLASRICGNTVFASLNAQQKFTFITWRYISKSMSGSLANVQKQALWIAISIEPKQLKAFLTPSCTEWLSTASTLVERRLFPNFDCNSAIWSVWISRTATLFPLSSRLSAK